VLAGELWHARFVPNTLWRSSCEISGAMCNTLF
jgi:hypothetical protein